MVPRPGPEFAERLLAMGHARLDCVLLSGFDDSPEQLRALLAHAGTRTVACVIEQACQPMPSLLARPSLDPALQRIAELKHPGTLATALGTSRRHLAGALRAAHLFPAKTMLAWWRLLVAARRLPDTAESVERVALELDYASATAFHNTCHRLLGAAASDIRTRGGLEFAGEVLRGAVQLRREKTAA